jgi:hypothetical protein
MAIYADFSLDQGASFAANIGIGDSDALDVDISGYTIFGQMRRSYSAPDAINLNCAIVNANQGLVSISLEPSVTSTLRKGRYFYDIIIIAPDGFITRVVEGLIDVSPAVTILL